MKLKQFINRIKNFEKLKKPEQVIYFSFYLTSELKQEVFFQKDIKNCFNELNLDLTLNLSNYFKANSNGKNKKFIKKGKGFSLEFKIREKIKLELNIDDSEINDEEKLISYSFEDRFYAHLLREINKTYFHDCHTASFILIRKLFENFLIDILRNNFKDEKIYIYHQITKKI